MKRILIDSTVGGRSDSSELLLRPGVVANQTNLMSRHLCAHEVEGCGRGAHDLALLQSDAG